MRKILFIIICFLYNSVFAFAGPVQELMHLAETAFSIGDYIKARGYYIDITTLEIATSEQKNAAQHNINICNSRIIENDYNHRYSQAFNLYKNKKFDECLTMCHRLISFSKYRTKTENLILLCEDSISSRIYSKYKTDSIQQQYEKLRLEYKFWLDKADSYYNNKVFDAARTCFEYTLDSKYDSIANPRVLPLWLSRCDSILEYKKNGGVVVTRKLADLISSATYLGDFSEGMAYVEFVDSLNERTAYIINTDGDIVCRVYRKPIFHKLFHDGFLAVNGYPWGSAGFINSCGKWIKPGSIDGIYPYDCDRFSEGRAPFMNEKMKWGYVDTNMRVIIPAKYDYVTSFSEGLALVRKGRKWSFIDKFGKEILKSFNPGIGNYETGFQEKNGNHYFSDGISWIWDKHEGGIVGIDKHGNICLTQVDYGLWTVRNYLHYWPHFNNGLCPIGNRFTTSKNTWDKRCKYGFMNTKGSLIIPQIYDMVYPFSEGLALVVKDSQYGYVDTVGNIVIPINIPFSSQNASSYFSEGLVNVQYSGLWGYMDRSGHIKIPCSFDFTGAFHSGLAKVRSASPSSKGKYGYVDVWGNSTFDFE